MQEQLHKLKRKVKKAEYSLRSRLLSIDSDLRVVESVITYLVDLNLCVAANLRNGRWYLNHVLFQSATTCYFKSTDGHDNQYVFSLSRLNLDFALKVAGAGGGLVVDSTRQGKRFPDSFKATIPIWAACINALIFCEHLENEEDIKSFFYAPSFMMTKSLIGQIQEVICSFVRGVPLDIKNIIRRTLLGVLKKPLRCFWLYPDSDECIEWLGSSSSSSSRDGDVSEVLEATSASYASLAFTPLLLLSCSGDKTEETGENSAHSWKYIQGAGDDEEHWSMGLTSELFHVHKEFILSSDDPIQVERNVQKIVEESAAAAAAASFSLPTMHMVPTPGLQLLLCYSSPSALAEIVASQLYCGIIAINFAEQLSASSSLLQISDMNCSKKSSQSQKGRFGAVILAQAIGFFNEKMEEIVVEHHGEGEGDVKEDGDHDRKSKKATLLIVSGDSDPDVARGVTFIAFGIVLASFDMNLGVLTRTTVGSNCELSVSVLNISAPVPPMKLLPRSQSDDDITKHDVLARLVWLQQFLPLESSFLPRRMLKEITAFFIHHHHVLVVAKIDKLI